MSSHKFSWKLDKLKEKSPCYNCYAPKRYAGCKAVCEEFLLFDAECQRVREEIRVEKYLDERKYPVSLVNKKNEEWRRRVKL